jgi:hypothetical protein
MTPCAECVEEADYPEKWMGIGWGSMYLKMAGYILHLISVHIVVT